MEIVDHDESPALAVEVSAALERLARVVRQLGPPSDMSIVAVAALARLERTGPHRLTDLAASEGVTQPAMTQMISRLADAGLVTRAADPADGRVVRVHITAAGRTTLADRRANRARRVADLLGALSPDERAALGAALPAIDAFADLATESEQHGRSRGSRRPPLPATPPGETAHH